MFLFSNGSDESLRQTGNPPRELWLCVFSPSPLPLLSATEPDAAPALISPLQTATLTGSAAPKASAHSPRLKTLLASVRNPSERKGIQGERPSFTSILQAPPPPKSPTPPAPRSHTLDRSHHLWMTLFINKIQCALFLTAAEVKLHLK